MNYNKIKNFADFSHIKELADSLKTIYLQNNPVAMNPAYRQKVMELVPKIEQIDSFRINTKFVVYSKNTDVKPLLKNAPK